MMKGLLKENMKNNFSKIEDLIKKRKRWVEATNENKFDIDSLLTGIYTDPSHFIFEILQNAEDAHAKKVIFHLEKDMLKIYHDGRDFNYKDVDGITGIGISTKKDDINAIGKFGVGFKSVYAITKTPIINSGDYHFSIYDMVVPRIINNKKIRNTTITLNFDHELRDKNETYEIIEKKLETIGLKTLLFLKRIKIIQWKSKNSSGLFEKNITPV